MTKTTRTEVTIIRTNDKGNAYLVESTDGRTGWVLARSYDEKTSTITATAAAKLRTSEQVEAAKFVSIASFFVARETEKAIAITVETCDIMGTDRSRTMWIPKSQIKDNQIPRWLWIAKCEEITDNSGNFREMVMA